MLLKHRQLQLVLGASLASVATTSTFAATLSTQGNGWQTPVIVFDKWDFSHNTSINTSTSSHNFTNSGVGHRIPAITVAQGNLIAVSDVRYAGLSGNTDIVSGTKVNPVEFGVKVSTNQGKSWSSQTTVSPNSTLVSGKNEGYISDPAIVHDENSGKTFLFGYSSSTNLKANDHSSKFIMFSSSDGGVTWDSGKDLSYLKSDNYTRIFQGPGSGMTWNGVTYVAIQEWKPGFATSGFIYSKDGGQTWEKGGLLVPEGTDSNGRFATSESNVFHHKGELYLAARSESYKNGMNRVLYKTNDLGKTWTRVEETYLPDNVSKCQTSTHALTDDLYFVGYSTYDEGLSNTGTRSTTWITTNTGKRLELMDSPTNSLSGYTSITSDADNLYVLYEGSNNASEAGENQASIQMRKFNYSAREYASINRQVLERSQDAFYYQNQILSSPNHVDANYGSQGAGLFESVFGSEQIRVGLFAKTLDDISHDVAGTLAYGQTDYSAVVGLNGVLPASMGVQDGVFAGYQYSTVRYDNGAKDAVHSAILGYRANKSFEALDYTFALTGMASRHGFKRNNDEGMGRTADFASYSLGMRNELSKTYDVAAERLSLKPFIGLENIYFAHDSFTEAGGEDWNRIQVNASGNWSNKVYVGANAKSSLPINSALRLDVDLTGRYVKELNAREHWADTYQIWDNTLQFATPFNTHPNGSFEGVAKVDVNYKDKATVGVQATYDADNGAKVMGSVQFMF